jgi:cytochrome P450
MTDPRRYDLYGDAFKRNPYPTFADMRRDAPLQRQAGLDGTTPIWFVTRYADVEAMLRDKRFVRDARLALGPDQLPPPTPLDRLLEGHMLNRDGADHRRLRGLVSQAFTPTRVSALRPRIEAVANELLDAVQERGKMDLIAEFSYPLPTIVILEMLGVPTADRARFRDWSNALIAPPMTPEAQAAAVAHLNAFTDCLRALFAERRSAPRDDLLTGLVTAADGGDRLSEDELFATVVLLIVAGHETTVNLIANAVLAMSRAPGVRDRLRHEPTMMPQAVEEFLRFDGSVERAINRFAAEDVEWDGHLIRRGEPVILILASANRDDTVFADADGLEIERHPNPHLGFGKGHHYCLGAPLARLETEVALNMLLERLPGLRVAIPEEELRWRFLPGFRALEALPVTWDAGYSASTST